GRHAEGVREGREARARLPGRRALAACRGDAGGRRLHERRRPARGLPGPRRARLEAGGPAGVDRQPGRPHVRRGEEGAMSAAAPVYLVTGGTGVLGGAVVSTLLAEGARVAVPHRDPEAPPTLRAAGGPDRLVPRQRRGA